jgi:DNA-binding LacI/PurR family transcriptional regulator
MSTIDLKMRNLGNAAADLLLYAMENPGRATEDARLLSVDPELVIRNSTAKPAAS